MRSRNYKMNNEVLLVEDDTVLSLLLKTRLNGLGYQVLTKTDGREGLKEALSHKFKLIILDIGLPGLDGFSILKELNDVGIKSEVMVITSMASEKNQIDSFKTGGSLFHSKPLNLKLFDAQVEKLINKASFNSEIKIADLFIEPEKMYIQKGKNRVDLTPREFEILLHILDADGAVMSRTKLLSHISKGKEYLEESSIDKIVSRTRKKIGQYKGEQIIETVHRKGYRINPICKAQD